MTPQEKAKELHSKYFDDMYIDFESSMQCADMVCDAVLDVLASPPIENTGHSLYDDTVEYWQSVKQYIQQL